MGKWIDRIKEKDNEHALDQSDRVDTPVSVLTLSTMSPPTSCVVKKNSCIDICKRNELKAIIKRVNAHYGGDDEYFLAEYINDILMKSSIDAALMCFHDLVAQIPPVNNRK